MASLHRMRFAEVEIKRQARRSDIGDAIANPGPNGPQMEGIWLRLLDELYRHKLLTIPIEREALVILPGLDGRAFLVS
jgi:hypothetical protein